MGTVLRLSQYRVGFCWQGNCNSRSKDWSYVNSVTVFAKALNSASVVDLATVFCFFDPQDTRFGPMNTQ